MGKLHVYTGNGKGKTTCAMGLAARALGHDRKVVLVQFLKDDTSGELRSLERLGALRVTRPVSGFVRNMTSGEKEMTAASQTELAREAIQVIRKVKPDIVVLDELNVAMALGMIPEEMVTQLLDTALDCAETIVTGRNASASLIERGDYVTEFLEIRHPFHTEGLAAREGIEW